MKPWTHNQFFGICSFALCSFNFKLTQTSILICFLYNIYFTWSYVLILRSFYNGSHFIRCIVFILNEFGVTLLLKRIFIINGTLIEIYCLWHKTRLVCSSNKILMRHDACEHFPCLRCCRVKYPNSKHWTLTDKNIFRVIFHLHCTQIPIFVIQFWHFRVVCVFYTQKIEISGIVRSCQFHKTRKDIDWLIDWLFITGLVQLHNTNCII